MRQHLIGPPDAVAPRLLGARLVSASGGEAVAVRVVEVEAYGGADDPASHAYRGKTERNRSMFEEAGLAYLYFTYGMHWCLNVVTGRAGEPAAVLLRAGAVVDGVDVARQRRLSSSGRAPADRDLARGPARLTQVLGVDGEQDGVNLLDDHSPLRLHLPEDAPLAVASGPRVGVRLAADRPWRFWLPAAPEVSSYRPASTRPARSPRVPSPPP